MKLKLASLFLMLLLPSAEALQLTVPIQTNILKPENSSNLIIEYERDVFSAAYKQEKQTFDDILIPFTVKTSSSTSELYKITLQDSYHVCEDDPINVSVSIDATSVAKGDFIDDLDFLMDDADFKWTEHRMNLHFPKIVAGLKSKSCQGNVGILVELKV
ncbi:hypothetical protein CGI23_24220 [Vibrio parahaemolyticus]|uniref:hypothetical protein n=1 Tax=Vibrio parahaemolyticus TaxID=670 RepID=UPI00111F670B|nr:hypothetical protein [Vibrio parahaemolyticus]TOK18362.1 hypothetical protein CGI23_24220 [Vibrio parahaemolyticus]